MDIEGLILYSSERQHVLRLEKCSDTGEHCGHEPAPEQIIDSVPLNKTLCYRFVRDLVRERTSIVGKGMLKVSLRDYPNAVRHDTTDITFKPSYEQLCQVLLRKASLWKQEFSRLTLQNVHEHGFNIIDVVRDTIFGRLCNITDEGYNFTGRCGFWLSCYDASEAYDFCLRICRSAFWLRGGKCPGNADRRIYEIGLSEYAKEPLLNLCYSSNRYISCCCKVCRDVLRQLREDAIGDFPSKSCNLIYRIISESTEDVLTFLYHNRSQHNLEHQLLCASLDAFLSKTRMKEKALRWSAEAAQVKGDILDDCGCFILVMEPSSMFGSSKSKSDLNNWAVVVDVLREYSSMWAAYALPVHLFCCYQVEQDEARDDTLLYDVEASNSSAVDCADYMLKQLDYFRYHVDLTSIEGGSDMQRERYLRKKLDLRNDEDSESILRYLVSLTSGYGMRRLEVITRMASCEYMAALQRHDKELKSPEAALFKDVSLAARCFEIAVSITPAVSPPVGMPGLRVLTYSRQSDKAPLSCFPPLSLKKDGRTEVLKGLPSLVLSDKLLKNLQIFIDTMNRGSKETMPFVLIEGPSGCGKTQLALAIAHEMRSTIAVVNVLDFLRPQVGASEKLVHEFFSKLLQQYDSAGSGNSAVRCIVALEGNDCLVEETAYTRSLKSALCTELSRFRERALWKGGCAVLFVVTCQNVQNVPERLREVCSFSHHFDLGSNMCTIDDVARCFELYLNGRGALLDRFHEIWPLWRETSSMSALRPCDIAFLCRLATLWSLNRQNLPVPKTMLLGKFAEALSAVKQ